MAVPAVPRDVRHWHVAHRGASHVSKARQSGGPRDEIQVGAPETDATDAQPDYQQGKGRQCDYQGCNRRLQCADELPAGGGVGVAGGVRAAMWEGTEEREGYGGKGGGEGASARSTDWGRLCGDFAEVDVRGGVGRVPVVGWDGG